MKVAIYWNFHRKCYSVVDKAVGRVAFHASTIVLEDVQFRVSERGRQRVLDERRKNVHAKVHGTLQYVQTITGEQHGRNNCGNGEGPIHLVGYNPYEVSHFTDRETSQPVTNSPLVFMYTAGTHPIITYSKGE